MIWIIRTETAALAIVGGKRRQEIAGLDIDRHHILQQQDRVLAVKRWGDAACCSPTDACSPG